MAVQQRSTPKRSRASKAYQPYPLTRSARSLYGPEAMQEQCERRACPVPPEERVSRARRGRGGLGRAEPTRPRCPTGRSAGRAPEWPRNPGPTGADQVVGATSG